MCAAMPINHNWKTSFKFICYFYIYVYFRKKNVYEKDYYVICDDCFGRVGL
jgi:hypothetical protein